MPFSTIYQLESIIYNYFLHTHGKFHLAYDDPPEDESYSHVNRKTVAERDPDPPTLTGLILFIGLDSRAAFDALASKGKFASTLRKARLRIESVYEKKLHQSAPTGAIFALKNMGWNDGKDSAQTEKSTAVKFKVDIASSPTIPAASEREVVL